MSDAGDDIPVEEVTVEAEPASDAPKGKLSVEDALQVRHTCCYLCTVLSYPHSKS